MRLLRLLYALPLRIRSLFRRDRVEEELDDELRDHLERRIEADIARGMTADDARYAAMRAMGGVEQRKRGVSRHERHTTRRSIPPGHPLCVAVSREEPGFCLRHAVIPGFGGSAQILRFSA
jgi:hypothetical protein